jgi:hypothetical protein
MLASDSANRFRHGQLRTVDFVLPPVAEGPQPPLTRPPLELHIAA